MRGGRIEQAIMGKFFHTPAVLTGLTLVVAALQPVSGGELGAAREAELMNRLIQDCGSCHGLTMKGGLGPPLLPENLEGLSDEALVDTILNGREGTPMPPWSFELSEAEAAWMVGVLRKGVNNK